MTRDFVWWIWHSARNRVRRQAGRLRNPRYLIAVLLGLLYFGLIFSGWFTGEGGRAPSARRLLNVPVVPVGLALLTAWWWLWGGYRRAILLTPAETDLLLPAPITRRSLVRFKIMQAQLPMLISVLLFTAFTRGAPLVWPLRALSLWLLFATLYLHQIAASLVHAAAEEQGGRGLRRNRVAVALFSIGFIVLGTSVVRAVLAARATSSLTDAAAAALHVLSQPAPRFVLAPFRWLIAPTAAGSVSEWLPAVAIAAVMLALHYVWVQRTDAAFEETAAAEGARQAEQIAAVRAGGMMRSYFTQERRPARLAPSWLGLEPIGVPAYALFWKNLLYAQRLVRRSSIVTAVFVGVMVLGISFSSAGSDGRALPAVATILLSLTGMMTLFGPFMFRNDLRIDLPFIDQLRTFPLRGRDVIVAGTAASAACVTVTQLLMLFVALMLGVAGGLFGALLALGIAAAALFVLPVMNTMSVLIQNMIALLFPAWIRLGAHGGGGMESIGQNMLNLIGTVVMLVLVTIPPVLIGLLVGAPMAMLFGEVAVLPGAAAVIASIGLEAALLTRWLGRLYDSLDPVEAELLR